MRRLNLTRQAPVILALAAMAVGVTAAATPPTLVNYQGVLRDASDKPRNGTFSMTFHFFDAVTAGNEILVDAHMVPVNGVDVAGGLFNVALGGGTVTDGSGAGTYTSLGDVFRDYDTVYLEIQIGAETLSPRLRVVAAPYALNAGNLQGKPASSFLDTSATGQTKAGHLTVSSGIDASAGSGFGINASGGQAGGSFGAGGAFAYVADTGVINTGIRAQGNDAGGWFKDNNGSGQAYLGSGDYGIDASGNSGGGYFHTATGSGVATLATGNIGLFGSGSLSGGQFKSADNTSLSYAGYPGYGIYSVGDSAGALFIPTVGATQALVGTPTYGVDAIGNSLSGTIAGRFRDLGTGAAATLADYSGIFAVGGAGGVFDSNLGSGVANIAIGNWGLYARGEYCGAGCGGGGEFQDSLGGATTYVAYSDVGIETHAAGSGGSFYNTNGIATAVATSGGYGLTTNGTKNFVQNHPEDPGAVIAYTALEGDEAGTYTRGTARLIGGEARIPLGETFQWVTNPDIGLTASLTPMGEWTDLYVASVSTKELVVRSRDTSQSPSAAFFYVVFGLREGFESMPVVREKEHEMPIPAKASGEDVFSHRPDLQRFTALSRFERMRQEVGGEDKILDRKASEILKAKIHVFDPARDRGPFAAPVSTLPVGGSSRSEAGRIPRSGTPVASAPTEGSENHPSWGEGTTPQDPVHSRASSGEAAEAGATVAAPAAAVSSLRASMAVRGSFEAGDVVAADPLEGGSFKRSDRAGDPGVAGIATDQLSTTPGEILVAVAGVALCKADAGFGPIHPGDLLVTSPTPGHAMAAHDPAPGTVIGKALEALASGTGTLRVLVMPR